MRIRTFAAAAAFIALSAAPAAAQEVTLRAVTAFAEGTQFSKNFERFIEKVNADGKGIIRINYISTEELETNNTRTHDKLPN